MSIAAKTQTCKSRRSTVYSDITCNLSNANLALGRYEEEVSPVFLGKCVCVCAVCVCVYSTTIPEQNGKVIRDTISLNGDD